MLTTNSKNTNIRSDISSPTMKANSPAESGNATTAGSQASAEVTDLGDDDFGPIKKGKNVESWLLPPPLLRKSRRRTRRRLAVASRLRRRRKRSARRSGKAAEEEGTGLDAHGTS